MSCFADSSALVKLYADEADHEAVRALESIIVAQIARIEVPAALWRKHRMGELTSTEATLLVAQFEADWFGAEDNPRRFGVVRMTSLVIEDAAYLTRTHHLRAYDAVQMATARAVRTADPDITMFVAYDKTLNEAARTNGFTTVTH